MLSVSTSTTMSFYLYRILAIVGLLAAPIPTSAAIYDYAVPESPSRVLRLNMPDDLAAVRGILIWGNGASSDGRSRAEDAELVAFARSLDFCVLATGYWAYFSDAGHVELGYFTEGIAQLARQSGHPELVNAPWLPIGHSNGGQMSYGLNVLRPERVIAMVVSKGAFYSDSRPSAAALQTPGLLIAGELDSDLRRSAIRDLFEGNRPRGALWAWVEEEATDHAEHNSPEVIRPFIAECVRLRLPPEADPRNGPVALRALSEESGWLAEPESYQHGFAQIYSYGNYPGVRRTASWLPTERVAMIFRAFASYQKAKADTSLESETGTLVDRGAIVGCRSGPPVGDWRTIDLFEGATLLGRFTPEEGESTVLQNASEAGYLSFHGVVTYGNGSQSTTLPRRLFVRPQLLAHPSMTPPTVTIWNVPGALTAWKWSLCAGATSYRIETGASPAGPWNTVAERCDHAFETPALLAGTSAYYRVVATRPDGDLGASTALRIDAPIVHQSTSQLINLSARGNTGPDADTLIAGVAHSGKLRVLARAIGPTLDTFGVTDAIRDPSLRLVTNGGATMTTNGDWGRAADVDAVEAAATAAGAFPLPRSSLDAAALATLPNDGTTHSMIVESTESGTALAEIYALDGDIGSKLTNLSVRGPVSPGKDLIAGLSISGAEPVTMLLRGAGPALRSFGLPSALRDPSLTLYRDGRVVMQNGKWEAAANVVAVRQAFAQTGAFSFSDGSDDAALLVTLAPGSYSIVASSRGGASGVVLIELYLLP